jgi:predicted ABC-type ATPase
MSHPSKVESIRRANNCGYRTYLYFVATEDPEINVARIRERVSRGGHDVPEAKTRSRYVRSLENLYDAIKMANRAYIFDNSYSPGEHFLIAQVESGLLTVVAPTVPAWFKHYVLHKA